MALERDKLVAQRALLTLDETQLLDVYRKMVTIRRFEEKAAEMYTKGKITGFCHLYAGEEAVAVVRESVWALECLRRGRGANSETSLSH